MFWWTINPFSLVFQYFDQELCLEVSKHVLSVEAMQEYWLYPSKKIKIKSFSLYEHYNVPLSCIHPLSINALSFSPVASK